MGTCIVEMRHAEHSRLQGTAERMIGLVADGDEERFRTVWNSLTARDQRTIAVRVLAEVAQLRDELDDPDRIEPAHAESPGLARTAFRVITGGGRRQP